MEIRSVEGENENEYPVLVSGAYTPEVSWLERKQIEIQLNTPKDLEIRVYPSDLNDSNVFGDVWLWGLQFERVEPWRCGGEVFCSGIEALPYEETDKTGMTVIDDCPDYSGATMRSESFRRSCVCPGNQNGECSEEGLVSENKICYRYTTVTLPLEGIESGRLIPSNNIAIGNFNYRQDSIAVNLVGTNVRTCENAEAPATCNSNAFIPYSLIHQGKVPVRNYHGKTYEYDMPTASVEHGKALAAEVLVTNPPTSNHNQLLGPYFKTGLRGRPLQGTYELRIWETPELNWDAVEDIQLIFRYRYWTRMSYGE